MGAGFRGGGGGTRQQRVSVFFWKRRLASRFQTGNKRAMSRANGYLIMAAVFCLKNLFPCTRVVKITENAPYCTNRDWLMRSSLVAFE